MCGIAGFITLNIENPKNILMNMINSIKYRGPDVQKVKVIKNDNIIGLAHSRLSILDLSKNADQPMSFNNVHIIYNGEIYNYIEIREELIKKGIKFNTNCDTEVILKAYIYYGIDFVKKINGMFAFAIYDENIDTTFLVRDRIGIKPLYFSYYKNSFLFSSELKALKKYPYISTIISQKAFSYYLTLQYVPAPLTIYENIYKLQPAHILKFKDNKIDIYKYWDIKDSKVKNNNIEELIMSSVKKRLISDVPIGAFLSGGIDSSIIASCMQKLSEKPIKTFTIGFNEEKWDESKYAKKIAHYLGTEHYEKIYSEKDILNKVELASTSFSEPFGDSSSLCTFLVSEMAKEQVTVILSGDGGDELFSGYNRYRLFEKLRYMFYIPFFIRRSLNILPKLNNFKLKTISDYFISNNEKELYSKIISILKPHQFYNISKNPEDLWNSHFLANNNFFNEFDNRSIPSVSDIYGYLPGDILHKVDICSMTYSLECRVPLLDHNIVEYAYSLMKKNNYKVDKNKKVLKKFLLKLIPKELFQRPKKGFSVPLSKWFKNELKELLLDSLSETKLKNSDFLKFSGVKKLIDEHLNNEQDHSHRLWIILMFQLFIDQ